MQPSATVTYLSHSGFTVETSHHILVFDYYRHPTHDIMDIMDIVGGKQHPSYDSAPKAVIVFASHAHADHFNPDIFGLTIVFPNTHYVLSSDIQTSRHNEHIHLVGPDAALSCAGTEIKTYGSTDAGVSFLVQVDGLTIFHAGDLNWWRWPDDTEQEQRVMEDAFKAEIAKIQKSAIDIAFFPVDSRLEQYYALGAEYFAVTVKPKLLIPMHFFDDPSISAVFAAKAQLQGIPTLAITQPGQIIKYPFSES